MLPFIFQEPQEKIRTLPRVLILYRKNPVNFTFTGFFLVDPRRFELPTPTMRM